MQREPKYAIVPEAIPGTWNMHTEATKDGWRIRVTVDTRPVAVRVEEKPDAA